MGGSAGLGGGREKPGMAPRFLTRLAGSSHTLPLGFHASSFLTFGRCPAQADMPLASVSLAEFSAQAPTGNLKCPHLRAPNKSLTDFKILRTRFRL